MCVRSDFWGPDWSTATLKISSKIAWWRSEYQKVGIKFICTWSGQRVEFLSWFSRFIPQVCKSCTLRKARALRLVFLLLVFVFLRFFFFNLPKQQSETIPSERHKIRDWRSGRFPFPLFFLPFPLQVTSMKNLSDSPPSAPHTYTDIQTYTHKPTTQLPHRICKSLIHSIHLFTSFICKDQHSPSDYEW